MLTLTELFMFFFRSIDYCLVVRSIKSENDIFTRFLVILSTYGTSILCAWSLTKSAISKADSFQIPIIFSKTLSLVSFLSVGVPLNLSSFCRIVPAFGFLVDSATFVFKFLKSDFEAWFCHSLAPLFFYFTFSFHLWIVIQFVPKALRIDFHIFLLFFCLGCKIVLRYNFLTNQSLDPYLWCASFSYGCFIWFRNDFILLWFNSWVKVPSHHYT